MQASICMWVIIFKSMVKRWTQFGKQLQRNGQPECAQLWQVGRNYNTCFALSLLSSWQTEVWQKFSLTSSFWYACVNIFYNYKLKYARASICCLKNKLWWASLQIFFSNRHCFYTRVRDVYLAVQAETQQHDEEQRSPQLKDGHGGEDFRVHNKHQARTWNIIQ